jgi:hypothetical protein
MICIRQDDRLARDRVFNPHSVSALSFYFFARDMSWKWARRCRSAGSWIDIMCSSVFGENSTIALLGSEIDCQSHMFRVTREFLHQYRIGRLV